MWGVGGWWVVEEGVGEEWRRRRRTEIFWRREEV